MIGDIDEEYIKENKALKNDFLRCFDNLEKHRIICEKIYKEYGQIIKIRRIYAKPKKNGTNEYYQVTYKKEPKKRTINEQFYHTFKLGD